MRSELRCEEVRSNVSALLDGELGQLERGAIESHLDSCDACRGYAGRIGRVRQLVRLQPVERVPDLSDRIITAIDAEDPPKVVRPFLRTAAIAAAAAALVFLGTSINIFDPSRDIATADEIVRRVQAAARDLSNYRASFDIIERGWHPDVAKRSMQAKVWFAAPERFRLEISDGTTYPPGTWPRNDVTLVASPRRWSISEPSACPTASLPACAAGAGIEQRTIVDRQPFDGNSALPTDIAIPLETLSNADTLEVLGSTEDLHRVALSVQQASPLVRALQPGGSWRPFHPLDRVEVWVDRGTWFPQRFRVVAGDSPDRELWAERIGVGHEAAGSVLFEVIATAFEEPRSLGSGLFRSEVAGAVSSGTFGAAPEGALSWVPTYTAGLSPYRAGAIGRRPVATFTDGMTWLKVVTLPNKGAAAAFASGAEIVALDEGRAFYSPADGRNGRRVDLYGPTNVRVESNLPRDEVLRVASSLPAKSAVPGSLRTSDGAVLTRVDPREVSAHAPKDVPVGYRLVSAVRSRNVHGDTSLSLYYRRLESSFEGDQIRVVRSSGFSSLPPSSEDFINVKVASTIARWSFERSELEWIDGSVYRSVAVPGNDLATALFVAGSID